MKPGFGLLEFMVALSFFCVMLLAGYAAWDLQQFLMNQAALRTWPEQGSNYRLLVMRNLLEGASAGFHQDSLTGAIPFFFPDLRFGAAPDTHSFSVAVPRGVPHHFERDAFNGFLHADAVSDLKPGMTLALGGNCGDQFCWNFARLKSIHTLDLEIEPLTTEGIPDSGALLQTDVAGFSFQDDTLYWISPAGQSEPFWPSLDDFQYEYNGGQLTLTWQTKMTNGRSVIHL